MNTTTANQPQSALDDARQLLVGSTFIVSAWPDPRARSYGWHAHSDSTLTFLAPVLGPTATLMLYRLTPIGDDEHRPLTVDSVAASLGLAGNLSVLVRTVGRLISFKMARPAHGELQVRSWIPPLKANWVGRFPDELRRDYLAQHITAEQVTP